ncbi:MAG TPA: TlpA disulfide reductase family protein [Solirubrobacteraceae bacterium]|jgi:thiol-disulfide isomerase/thioredoxin|nr:TlpA disulfide reductase family protein [Solirubrobacteraceae bacterium]
MPHVRAPLRRLLFWAAAAAGLLAVALFGLAASGGRNGHLAPALPRESLSGKAVTLAALRGHPVLVTFWASWCDPCAHEAAAIERFSKGLQGRATLVGVNWDDPSLSSAHAFVKRYGWTFPDLRDPEGATGLRFGLTGLPTTFVIDSSGRMRATLRGPQTQKTLNGALASVAG